MSLSYKPIVTLVGRRPPWCENLSLGYLQSALIAAGFDVRVLHLNKLSDIRKAADAILSDAPVLVGLSIPDSNSCFFSVALGEMLKRRGYRGHLTGGGQFATLARHWLLKRYKWLDSVVRFAGEITLVELTRHLVRKESVGDIGGLTTRRGDGKAAPVLEKLPMNIWPHRDELADRLGYKVALIMATRGCRGSCEYCGPAAIQRLERKEALLQGASRKQITGCGIGGIRIREVNDLCDEMAYLFHERDVRYFGFTDEHMVPFTNAVALQYLDAWHAGLRARKVDNFAMGGQLQCCQLSVQIAGKLAEMGLVRAHVGIDLGAIEDELHFGRPIFGEREAKIMDELNRNSVATISNLLLLHPYSSLETISQSIATLERVPFSLVEVGQMFVYHGTRLKERIAEEGRLLGNPLRYDYGFLDPKVARFAEIFTDLRVNGFGGFSVVQRAHELHFNLSLARRLNPKLDLSGLSGRFGQLQATIQAHTVEGYRRALQLARDYASVSEQESLIDEFQQKVRFINRRIELIETALCEIVRTPTNTSRSFRTMTASLFSLCMISSPIGCYNSNAIEVEKDAQKPTQQTDAQTPRGDSEIVPHETVLGLDAAKETGARQDATVQNPPDRNIPDADDAGDDPCSLSGRQRKVEEINEKLAEVPCFSGYVLTGEPAQQNDFTAKLSDPEGWYDLAGTDEFWEIENRANEAIKEIEFDCAGGQEMLHVFEGGVNQELRQIEDLESQQCPGSNHGSHDYPNDSYPIIIDENGKVTAVEPYCDDPRCIEDAACLFEALKGLTFSCLANSRIGWVTYMTIL